jgi:hypothetical protein
MNAMPLPPPDAAVTLVRIEVKLDAVLTKVDDHEGRLRALESRNWPRQSVNTIVSVCAALAAVATVVEGLLIR